MRLARAAAALLLLTAGRASAAPDRDEAGAVTFHGTVRLRATADQDVPSPAVRFDPAAQALTVGSYLRPQGSDRRASALAALSFEGRHRGGDLRWILTLDTGELRSERPHRSTRVCWSRTSATGLGVPGGGACDAFLVNGRLRPVVFAVEDTRRRGAEVTSNRRPFADEADATWFLREAYGALRFGRAGFLTASAGRKRMTVGDGYLHDDYATGVEVRADLGAIGPPLELAASVFQPTRDLPGEVDGISPMVVLRADYLPSLFEHAGVFAVGLRERSGAMGNVFRGALIERLVRVSSDPDRPEPERASANRWLAASLSTPFDSDATMGWLGTSGLLRPWKGGRLGWTGALLHGTLRRVTAGGGPDRLVVAEDVSLRGRLLSLRLEAELSRALELGASFLYLSGGDLPRRAAADGELPPASGTYRGFLAVSPYLAETDLFFGGGLSESFADRQVRAPGVNGRGVLAPLLSARWSPGEAVELRLRGAWLRADVAGPFGGRTYGTEADLTATWDARAWLRLGAEADALFPGDFFPSRRPITRVVLALDVQTP